MTSEGKQYVAVPVTTSDAFITYPVIDAKTGSIIQHFDSEEAWDGRDIAGVTPISNPLENASTTAYLSTAESR
jgi:hypothetical protein